MSFHHVGVLGARMNLRNGTAPRVAILAAAVVLMALAAGLLMSAPGPVHGSSHEVPGKPLISNWDRLVGGLRVHWYAPDRDGGSPIIRYEVQYRETGQSEWLDGPRVGAARKANITSLVPDTEYQARVRAVNANGAGPWSSDPADRRRTRSAAGAQPDPPDVTVIPRNGSLTVSFDPPSFNGWPPLSVTHFNVQYTPFDGSPYTYQDWTVNGSADFKGPSVTITGLENGQDHLVRVRGHNGRDAGHWSVDYHGIPTPDTPFLKVEQLVTGLEIPWDLAFTPDGTMLFTQRKGVLSARLTDGTVQNVNANLDDVEAVSEGGLMSIAIDPSFSSNRRFYTCQTIDAVTRREVEVVAWTIDATYKNATRADDPLVGGIPGGHGQHNGCRLRFGPDGYLWITTGDAAVGTGPQSLSSLAGKVLRVDASDGSGADGNPFESAPLVYTYGHRNAQGLALRPDTRQMWVVEHGPRVDDEINLLQSGGNYGWDPVPADSGDPSYNQSVPMTDLDKYSAAVAAKWSSGSPTLATSGGIFLEGEQWGNWEGRLAVAALRDRELHLFDFNPDGEFQGRLSAPELELEGIRLRSPVLGPDGALYITTSQRSPTDLIYRVTAFTAPDPPAEVAVVRGGDGELVAEWPAPSHDGGSAITGYQLRYSTDGTTWTEVSGTVTGKRWTVIDGLTNGDEYQVQARAVNAAGPGDWSPSGRGTPAAAPVIRVETVVTGVSKPWGLAFAPDGTMMFTERGGQLKVRLVDGTVRTVNADFTDIGADWETGLMGMVIDPDFGVNRHFYTCQGHQDPNTDAASIQVIKWSMNSDYTAATRVGDPLVGGVGIRIGSQWQHAGCRLRFGPQGHLWIATGDGYSNSINPQDLTNLNGKMLRVHKDTGEGVPGNPFYDRANANSKRVYTYGHRNPQGLARRPGANQMWSVEHGTNRDDEINLLTPGGNYGYAPHGHRECGPPDDRRTIPPSMYCVDSPMTDLDRFPNAVEARWSSGKPTLATSGGIFLEGERWGAWEGRLAVATLKTRSVRLFNFTPQGSFISIYELPEIKPFDSRLRTPMMGPDGALYVTTSDNSPSSEENPSFQSNDETLDRILRVYVYDAQADATLTGLRLTGSDGNPVPLSPEFATGVLRYSAEVTGDVTGVLVQPTKSRAGATVTVNGNNPSAAVALDPGLNTIAVVVTAQDGATTRTYTIDATQTTSPAVSAEISDVTLVKTGAATSITLGDHFSDADGDALTYQATSGDPAKVAVSVDNAAGALTVTGAAHGSAQVTVTATDDDGNSASDAFTVTVKAAPVVASAMADVTGLATAATREVSLSGVFTDADNDALTVTAVSSDDSKATVSVAGDYSSLTVTGVAEGTATITATAQDSDGNQASDAFDVTVVSGVVLPSNLTGLGITGMVTRGGETFTFPLISNPWFDPDTAGYTIRVPSDLQSITFTPTWTGNEVVEVTLLERNSDAHSGSGSQIGQTSTSGSALTNSSNPKYPGVRVRNRTGSGTNDAFHYFNLQGVAAQPSFGGATVADKTFTAGAAALRRGLTQDQALGLRLPKATVEFYSGVVTYTATGLPDGLYMDYSRLIRGTPEEATTSPAEVDYTATDGIGGSATLHFHVTVAPPLAFDAAERQAFKDTIFEYTVGQAEPINATLPEATGGHGTLTYGLTYWAKEQRTLDGRQVTSLAPKSINDDAPGFFFDANTRVLSSDTGMAAPSAKAFYSVDYWVEDENGARAVASNSIAVNEAPTLPEIADRSFTVGENVSLTLPKAEGGTQVGIVLRYRLEPAVAGLFFNGRQHVRSLTGRPTVPGTTAITYTATDRNNVSATRAFNVTVVNGPGAPTSAPTSVQAAQAYSGADPNGSGAAAVWDTVSGATDYVVQVRADGGSYPDLAVNSAPADVNLSLPDPDQGLVWINAISTGDYKVRVAARNADGVGPWSVEVGFTVSGTPPQSGGQNPPCDTCGTQGDVGAAPPPGTPNRAPTVSAAIGDATIVNQSGTRQVSLSGVFDDADGDSLTITAAASDEAVATVSMAADNSSLTVNAQARGVATVTVTADDGKGGAVRDAFTITVKTSPEVAQPLGDAVGLEVGATQEVPLTGVFSDADGDALTISAASSDDAKATVTVSADQSTLTLAGIAEGTATITVTAQDSDGNRVSDVLEAPVARKYNALIARMYQWREDPQWRHQKSHTDRWDRALLAFGETVADSSLTPMTAAGAQALADQDWGVRWVPVAAALWEIEGGGQQETPNAAPTVSAAISDATIVNRLGTHAASLSGVFSDGDNDALTITAASSVEAVATVSVAADQSSLTVTAKARGTAIITVTAADGKGGTVSDTFTVTVKAAPVVASDIADMDLKAGATQNEGGAQDVTLSAVFSDADGDSLTFTADTSDSCGSGGFTVPGHPDGGGPGRRVGDHHGDGPGRRRQHRQRYL